MPVRRRTRFVLAAPFLALLVVAVHASGATAFTWSTPQPIPRPTTNYKALSLEVGTDELGNQLVAYGSFGLWLLERSAGSPLTGSPVRVSSPNYGIRDYDAAVAGDGAAAVAWIEKRRRHYRVRALVRDPGGAYRAPVDLASTRKELAFRNVEVGVDAAGGVLVAWDAGVNHRRKIDHIEAAYRPAGGQFRNSRRVSRTGGGLPVVGMSPDGRGTIAWVRRNGIETLAVNHGDFAKPERIDGPRSARATELRLAVHADGAAVIGWISNQDAPTAKDPDGWSLVLRAARRAPGAGRFAKASRLLTRARGDARDLDDFDVAAGPGGRAVVVVQESRRASGGQGGLEGTHARLRGAYARGVRGFGDLIAISPSGQRGYAGRPALAFTPQGALVAAWAWYLDPQHGGVQIVSDESGAIAAPTTIPVPMTGDFYGVAHVGPRLTVAPSGIPTAFWFESTPIPSTTPGHPPFPGPDEPRMSIGLPSR